MVWLNSMTGILIVDDNEADRAVIMKSIREELTDPTFHEASTRDDFLTLLDNDGLDLIICDLNIFNLDVFEIIRMVNDRKKRIPVIIYTGIGSEELAVRTLKMGADDYIIKSSLHLKDLGIKVRASLDHFSEGSWDGLPVVEGEIDRDKVDGSLGSMIEKITPLHLGMLDDSNELEALLKDGSLDTAPLDRIREKLTRSLSIIKRARREGNLMEDLK